MPLLIKGQFIQNIEWKFQSYDYIPHTDTPYYGFSELADLKGYESATLL